MAIITIADTFNAANQNLNGYNGWTDGVPGNLQILSNALVGNASLSSNAFKSIPLLPQVALPITYTVEILSAYNGNVGTNQRYMSRFGIGGALAATASYLTVNGGTWIIVGSSDGGSTLSYGIYNNGTVKASGNFGFIPANSNVAGTMTVTCTILANLTYTIRVVQPGDSKDVTRTGSLSSYVVQTGGALKLESENGNSSQTAKWDNLQFTFDNNDTPINNALANFAGI